MSSSTAVLTGDLGPRGRRQAFIASVVAGLALLGVLYICYHRLDTKGQLEWALWKPLTQWSVIKFLLTGLLHTVEAAAVSMVIALTVGAVMALGRLAHNRPVRWLAGVYVELFRALPLYLLILFAFLVPPQFDFNVPPGWSLVVGLSLYNSAMLAEIFRAGILSLDRGQAEAATSLGMTYWQSMGLVVVPQSVRRMIPSIISQCVALLKDTSLGFAVTYEEFLRRGEEAGTFYFNMLQSLVVVALVYMVVNIALSRLAGRLEARQRQRFSTPGLDASIPADVANTEATVLAPKPSA